MNILILNPNASGEASAPLASAMTILTCRLLGFSCAEISKTLGAKSQLFWIHEQCVVRRSISTLQTRRNLQRLAARLASGRPQAP
jgi:hypothetical protein